MNTHKECKAAGVELTNQYYPKILECLGNYTAPVHKYDEELKDKFIALQKEIDDLIDKSFLDYEKGSTHVQVKNNITGEVNFNSDIQHPIGWPERAVITFATKYLLKNTECSIFSAIKRIVRWITMNGIRAGHLNYLYNDTGCVNWIIFVANLIDGLINRRTTFNSPVWFNVSDPFTYEQSSACFVTEIEDNMGSILAQNVVNQIIALGGSGSGCDFSTLRSKREWIGDKKGHPAGPMGFANMFNAVLHHTKSGGRFRRAAGMITMFVDHPDIMDFITFKAREEKKGKILSQNLEGWDNRFASEDQYSVFGTLNMQDVNLAVRLTEEFWTAYNNQNGSHKFDLYDRKGQKIDDLDAKEILSYIAKAQMACGDPGIQYDDNVNAWNPFVEHGIYCKSTNACSELQYINNSACNLASIRLTAYYNEQTNAFDYILFADDIATMIIAQDILIDFSSYPTAKIANTSYETRNVGLNFGDLGELLFQMGIPYDSIEGRAVAGILASFMTVTAAEMSVKMGEKLGSFDWFEKNLDVREGMYRVFDQHKYIISEIQPFEFDPGSRETVGSFTIKTAALTDIQVRYLGIPYHKVTKIVGFENLLNTTLCKWQRLGHPEYLRNATFTVMAPMGTVGPALGCQTTGIEPHFSHSYKKDLVGGGDWNYSSVLSDTIKKRFEELYPSLNYYKLLETAVGTNGENILPPIAHVKMMAAVQPHISLGIAKTCNCPNDIKLEEVIDIYVRAWEMGLKAITIYRDGSKTIQPLTANKITPTKKELGDPAKVLLYRFPVMIGGEKMHLMIGWHPEHLDDVWEIWVRNPYIGGTLDGSLSTFAILASRSLQHGLKDGTYDEKRDDLVKTMLRMTYPPNGLVIWPNGCPLPEFQSITSAKSVANLIGQMLASVRRCPTIAGIVANTMGVLKITLDESRINDNEQHYCIECGRLMVKSGMTSGCYKCTFCGSAPACG